MEWEDGLIADISVSSIGLQVCIWDYATILVGDGFSLGKPATLEDYEGKDREYFRDSWDKFLNALRQMDLYKDRIPPGEYQLDRIDVGVEDRQGEPYYYRQLSYLLVEMPQPVVVLRAEV